MLNLGKVCPDKLVYTTREAYNTESQLYINHAGNKGLRIDLHNPWAVSDLITWKILNHLMKLVGENNDRNIKGLGAGSGDGIWELRLASKYRNLEIIGVDIADKLVRIANQRAKSLKLYNRCFFRVADIRKLEFIPDNSMDFVISVYDPLNHIPEPRFSAIKEFYRILKRGSYVFASVHSQSDFGFYVVESDKVIDYSVAHLENYDGEVIIFRTKDGKLHKVYSKRYTFEELKYEFEFAGFKVIEGYGIDIYAKRKLERLLRFSPKRLRREVAKLYLNELKLYKDKNLINSAIHIGILAQKPI